MQVGAPRNLKAACRLLLCALHLGACTVGDPFAGGGDSIAPSVATCQAQCDAQQQVLGCSTQITRATCDALCEQIAASLPTQCVDDYNAYYSCNLATGFTCVDLFVAPKTNACDALLAALDACTRGGAAGSGGNDICAGASSSGVCPEVPCPCPSAIVTVSGSSATPTGCACWDTVSCQSHACL